MRRQGRSFPAAVFALCAAIACVGCEPAWRAPIYQKNGFFPQKLGRFTIVAAVDARIDTTEAVQLDEQLCVASAKILTGKRYDVVCSPTPNGVGSPTIDTLKEPDGAWIGRLGPPEARWVMIVALVDVKKSLVFLGSTGNAEVSAFLYDKDSRELVWRDKGIGQVGQGGLGGMALVGIMSDEAINDALEHVFASFPVLTKGQDPSVVVPMR